MEVQRESSNQMNFARKMAEGDKFEYESSNDDDERKIGETKEEDKDGSRAVRNQQLEETRILEKGPEQEALKEYQ